MCISSPCFTITFTSLALYVDRSKKLNHHNLTENVFITPSQIYIHKINLSTKIRKLINDI